MTQVSIVSAVNSRNCPESPMTSYVDSSSLAL